MAVLRASLLVLLIGRAGGAATPPEQGSLIAGAEAQLSPEPAPTRALGCDMMDEAPPTKK